MPSRFASKLFAIVVLFWSAMFCPIGRGDILYLTPKGAEALKGKYQLGTSADGRHQILAGQIIIARDEEDRLILANPGKYFLFTPRGGAQEQLEWAWIATIHHDLDTVEDLRGMLSNRDKVFGNWDSALVALRSKLDSDGKLGLGRSSAGASASSKAQSSVPTREGYLTRYFFLGPMSKEEREGMLRDAHHKAPEDPEGYSPIDPRLWQETPPSVMLLLLSDIAHCQKYGEPESGMLGASIAITAFLTETICVTVPPSPAATRPFRVSSFGAESRSFLGNHLRAASPDSVSSRMRYTGAAAKSNGLVQMVADDDQKVNVFDLADAAVEVINHWNASQRDKPYTEKLIGDLVALASGRTDFLTNQLQADTAAYAGPLNAVASRAFDALVKLCGAAPNNEAEANSQLRDMLLGEMAAAENASSMHRARAAREALAKAGIQADSEVEPMIDALFSIGLSGPGPDSSRHQDPVYVLRHMSPAIKDAAVRQRYDQYFAKKIEQLRMRLESGNGGRDEQKFLDLLTAQ